MLHEHSARQAPPSAFTRFARMNNEFGKGIDVVYGIEGDTAHVQSIRFQTRYFSATDARRWLRAHGYDESHFEAATGDTMRTNGAKLPRMGKQAEAAAHEYRKAHWGVEADRVYEVRDNPHLPRTLVEMGKLRGLRLKGMGEIEFTGVSSLAYTQDRATRLYPVLSEKDRADVCGLVQQDKIGNGSSWMHYADVAAHVGGRQADFRSSLDRVTVMPLGVCTHVIYETEKQGDGRSRYIHKLGEERGGVEPWLVITEDGFLLFAGGSYVVEHRGIVN